MAGLGIRLFTDEHIFKDLARELRNRGYDAEGCYEVGRANQGISDEEQLEYATRRGCAILTEDRTDFKLIDEAWKTVGRQHAGIISHSASRQRFRRAVAVCRATPERLLA